MKHASPSPPVRDQIHALLDAIDSKLAVLPDHLREPIEGDLCTIRSCLEDGALVNNKARNTKLAESVGDGFMELDQDWRFSYVNERAASYMGSQPEDLIGKSIWGTFPGILGTPHEHYYRQVMEQRQPARFEMTGALSDQWYEIRVYPSAAGITVFWVNIAKRKQAEEELCRTREQLQLALEASQLGIFDHDIASGIHLWDRRSRELWGIGPDEIVTLETLLDGIHPDDRDQVRSAIDQAMMPGGTGKYITEYRVIHRGDGTVRWIAATGQVYFDRGQATRLVGTVEDISERKQIEQELAHSERKYRELIQYAPSAIYEIDFRTGKFLSINDSMVDLTGYSQEELMQMRASDLLDETSRALFQERIRQWLAGEKPNETVEYRVKAKDGHTIYAVLNATFTRDADGRPLGATVIGYDITERKQAEEDLARSNRKITEILSSITDDFYVLDRDWKFVYANKQFTGRIGKEPEDFVGNCIWEMFPEHVGTSLYEHFHASMEKDEIRRFETQGQYTKVWYSMTCFPSAEGITVLGSDISERKHVEQQLARDLDAMTRLQKLGTLYIQEDNLEPVLAEIIDAAIAITRADFGTIQLLDPASGDLRIAGHRGFPQWWLDFWNSVARGQGCCGAALERGERVIVEDVEQSPIFIGRPALDIQRKAGVCAVQSTPLLSRSGKPLGMFSTHSRKPGRPDDHALRLLDLLARQTADIIENAQTKVALRKNSEALRESQAILEAFFANSPGILNIEDEEFHYLKTDQLTPTYFGLDRQTIVGKAVNNLAPEFIDTFGPMMRRVVETGQPETQEVYSQVPGRPGEMTYWLATYFPVPLPGGKRGIGVVGVETTAQKKAEETQREHRIQLELQRRLLDYRDQERQAIARDLHDGPVQDIVSLLFSVQMVKEATADLSLKLELEKIAVGLRTTVQDLREMINTMRPPSLIRFGLAKALNVFLEDFREKHPEIEVNVSLMKDGDHLSEPARLSLFKIAQEALINTVKHAGASRIDVTLRCEDHQVVLEIHDDGKGFTLVNNLLDYSTQGHFGLIGMKERTEAINGELQVQSSPGEGTTIRVVSPINKV